MRLRRGGRGFPPYECVGVDAHIDPLETIGFAENCRKNGPVCRADVGIGPYDSDWKIIQILRGRTQRASDFWVQGGNLPCCVNIVLKC